MNAAADRLEDSYPHGTVEGYRRGCRGGVCPTGEQHGLSCRRAGQLHAGDYRYQKLVKRGLTPAAIADELGLIPETNATPTRKPSRTVHAEPVPAEPEPTPPTDEAQETEEPTMTEPTEPTEPTNSPEPTEPPTTADAAAPEIPPQGVIRAWARKNGIEVNPRGSVQKGVVNAYLFAHRTPTEPDTAAAATAAPVEEPADVVEATTEGMQMPDYLAGVVEPAAIPHPAEVDSPEYFIPLDTAPGRYSDLLDETRRRLGMEDHPSSWVPTHEIVPISSVRPEWADVAIAHDVEQARSIAARLEAENAVLVDQVAVHGRSLEFALRQWAAATDRANYAERRRAATIRLGLKRLRAERDRAAELRAENARLDAALAEANTRAAALHVQLEQARADEHAAPAKPRRLFGRAVAAPATPRERNLGLLGQRVRALYTNDGQTHATGRVIAYADEPTFFIETDDGERLTWMASLCEPNTDAHDATAGGAQ